MKLYWETYFEILSTDQVIRYTSNPLREYEDEFIDGAIIDIGCGQSNILLEYSNSERTLYAIDNEQLQLDLLKQRAEPISNCGLKNWRFIRSEFPGDELPMENYSVIILANLLHFFLLDECRDLEELFLKISQKGTLIYIQVHSHRYYANDPEDPDNNDYFKHYFKVEDFTEIFPPEKYERVYQAEIEKINSKIEDEITSKWLDKAMEQDGITDLRKKEIIKADYLKNDTQSDIQIIMRRK